VLSLSGLQQYEIRTYDLEIWKGCHIRTNEVGFHGNKPKLIFIHGYGGAGAVFLQLMKPLSEHFHAFFIDIVGMGCSSREAYKVKNVEESVDFFVRFVEEWRKVKNITNFFMCGHSLGGFISTLYTIKHQQHVKKLFLISPVGFSEKPKDFDVKRIEVVSQYDKNGDEILNKGPPEFAIHYVWPLLWNKRITLLDCSRMMG